MKKELAKLANHLDKKGLSKEADFLDSILKRASDDEKYEQVEELMMQLIEEKIEFLLGDVTEETNPERFAKIKAELPELLSEGLRSMVDTYARYPVELAYGVVPMD